MFLTMILSPLRRHPASHVDFMSKSKGFLKFSRRMVLAAWIPCGMAFAESEMQVTEDSAAEPGQTQIAAPAEAPASEPGTAPEIKATPDPVAVLLASEAGELDEDQRTLLKTRHDEILAKLPDFQKRIQALADTEADPGKRQIAEKKIREEARQAIQQRLKIQRKLSGASPADVKPSEGP
jgi:hypothetical protein